MKLCDYTVPELDKFRSLCNFTEDEKNVYDNLSYGNTIEETAENCHMGVSTVKRIKNRIWSKIDRLQSL